MATAPSPNDLTRQQLDELDALLQRMLSVPLSPADTPMPLGTPAPLPTPPSAPSWRVDPPAPAPAPAPHLVFPEPPSSVLLQQEPPPAPAPALPPPLPVAPKPAAKLPEPVFPPSPPKVVAPAPVAPPAPVPPRAGDSAAPEPAAPPVPLLYLPFAAVNATFDFVCGLLGPPGRLLRSGFLKQLYGLAGLVLLAYTAAHVAQEKGWLTLPVQLPWPPSR